MTTTRIPLVDLKANYAVVKQEVDARIHEVLDSAYFVGGPVVREFERQFADFCGVKECIGCNSGTDALFLAFKFLGFGEGDEVITQGNTFIATCLGASLCGITPVLVDIDPHTYMLDVSKIEAKITSRTKAIVPVHLYGHCADMYGIKDIADKHDLLVIEDAAQAHGATFTGRDGIPRRAGSMGSAGCFSFYPGKNLGAYGDGGAIVTNNPELAAKIRWWQNWGASRKYHHELKGGNSRLDAVQAAVLSVKVKYLDDWNLKRATLARFYSERLKGVGDLHLPSTDPKVQSAWHLYVVRTSYRDELLEFFKDEGVDAGIHYPIPICKLKAYEELEQYTAELPNCVQLAPTLLSLPLFPELTFEQVEKVVLVARLFFSGKLHV